MEREQKLIQVIGDRIALAKFEYQQHHNQIHATKKRQLLKKIRIIALIAVMAMASTSTYYHPATASAPTESMLCPPSTTTH